MWVPGFFPPPYLPGQQGSLPSPWLPAESQVRTANYTCKILSTQESADLVERLLINGLLRLTWMSVTSAKMSWSHSVENSLSGVL